MDGGFTAFPKKTVTVQNDESLPTSFSIAAGTSKDQVALIRLTALRQGVAREILESQVTVPTDRVAELTLILSQSCLDQVEKVKGVAEPICSAGESCQPATGTCGSFVVDKSLPTFDPSDLNDVNTSVGQFGHDAGEDGDGSAEDAGCVATASVIADRQPTPLDVVLDSNNVYWTQGRPGTHHGAVVKAPLGGGEVVTIVGDRDQPLYLLVDSTSVYWSEYTGGVTLLKAPLAGGDVTTLIAATSTGRNPFVFGGHDEIYVVESGNAQIVKVSKSGGAVTTLATDLTSPSSVAVDDASVYWTNNSDAGGVMSMPLSGGDASVLATGSDPDDVLVADGGLYWIGVTEFVTIPGPSGFPGLVIPTDAVLTVPVSGGHPVTLFQGGPFNRMVLYDSRVYVADDVGVISAPIHTQNESTTVVGCESHVEGIAVGPTGVYITSSTDAGSVFRSQP